MRQSNGLQRTELQKQPIKLIKLYARADIKNSLQLFLNLSLRTRIQLIQLNTRGQNLPRGPRMYTPPPPPPHQINTPSALITLCYTRVCVIIKWNNRGLSYAQKRFVRKVGKRLTVAQSCRPSQAFCRRVPVCKARPQAGEQGRRAGVGWRYARAADLSGSDSAAFKP